MGELGENISQVIRKNLLAVGLGTAGLICLVYGLTSLFPQKSQNDIIFSSNDQQSASESAVKGAVLGAVVVDVAGAVKKPGVYHVAEDSRVGDAITSAGGLSDEADTELIAKQFNLAMKVSDGMKLYIPKAGDIEQGMG